MHGYKILEHVYFPDIVLPAQLFPFSCQIPNQKEDGVYMFSKKIMPVWGLQKTVEYTRVPLVHPLAINQDLKRALPS